MRKIFATLALIATSQSLSAQYVVTASKTTEDEIVFWVLVGLIGLAASIVILLSIVVVQLIKIVQQEANLSSGEQMSLWERLIGFKPKSMEKKLLLDEEFDGIKELNNPIPAWFNWFFGVTIAFALLYLLIYHVWKIADLQEQEYEKEMQIAEIQKEEYLKKVANSIDEKNVTLVTDAKQLQTGQDLYKANCASCHGQKGEGLVGPNLTDRYWLYGGKISDVFKTIKYGTNKGMPSWQKQLNPLQIQQITSYIHSLKGSNPPNAKEPQGVEETDDTPKNDKAVSMK